ncbi:MAG: lipocalin family protein [Muribaculaceae bacterium]|nr:lipocalin family protein [Muribaculaceae bacterium]
MAIMPSCSKDDDPDDIATQMIGTWDATAVKFEGDKSWTDITKYPSMALSITFNKNGTYSGRGALGNGDGTYTVSGKTIKTYIDGELYGTYYVNEVSGNYAELTLTMGKSSMGIKATKR